MKREERSTLLLLFLLFLLLLFLLPVAVARISRPKVRGHV